MERIVHQPDRGAWKSRTRTRTPDMDTDMVAEIYSPKTIYIIIIISLTPNANNNCFIDETNNLNLCQYKNSYTQKTQVQYKNSYTNDIQTRSYKFRPNSVQSKSK